MFKNPDVLQACRVFVDNEGRLTQVFFLEEERYFIKRPTMLGEELIKFLDLDLTELVDLADEIEKDITMDIAQKLDIIVKELNKKHSYIAFFIEAEIKNVITDYKSRSDDSEKLQKEMPQVIAGILFSIAFLQSMLTREFEECFEDDTLTYPQKTKKFFSHNAYIMNIPYTTYYAFMASTNGVFDYKKQQDIETDGENDSNSLYDKIHQNLDKTSLVQFYLIDNAYEMVHFELLLGAGLMCGGAIIARSFLY